MSLKTDMADDLTTVFLDVNDHADACTYYPDGDNTGFAATLVMGPSSEAFIVQPRRNGIDDQTRADGFGSLAALRTGILARLGTVRDPRHGDRLTFASGAYAGTWLVQRVSPDGADGMLLGLQRDQVNTDAGADVQQVSG